MQELFDQQDYNFRVFMANLDAQPAQYCDIEVSDYADYISEKQSSGLKLYIRLKEEDDGESIEDIATKSDYKTNFETRQGAKAAIEQKIKEGFEVTYIVKQSQEEYKEIDNLIKKMHACSQEGYYYTDNPNDLKDNEVYEGIKKLKPAELKAFLTKLLHYITSFNEYRADQRLGTAVLRGLLRKDLKHESEQELFDFLTHLQKSAFDYYSYHYLSPLIVLKHLERFIKKQGMSKSIDAFVEKMLTWNHLSDYRYSTEELHNKIASIINDVLDDKDDSKVRYFKSGIKDVDQLIKSSELYNEKEFHHFLRLKPTKSKPTAKFHKEVAQYIQKLGEEKFKYFLHAVLELGLTQMKEVAEYKRDKEKTAFIRRTIWALAHYSDEKSAALLGKMLEMATKEGNMTYGPACVYILAHMPETHGLATLSRIKPRIKQKTVRKKAEEYLQEVADQRNITLSTLEEMIIPDHNLVDGKKTIAFGEYELRVSISGSKVQQSWANPSGKILKSVPIPVKKDEALKEQLKKVRLEIKEMQKVCSAQKEKFDNLFVWDQSWEYAYFEQYFLSHGLVSCIIKSIIFNIKNDTQEVDAIYRDQQWQTVKGEAVTWVDQDCSIKMWHPINATEGEIVAWRDYVIEHEIQQSLKQAFREIYILTDAERNTNTYSNRMASHVLKQHQFSALAELRDWKYIKIGYIDNSAGDAYRSLQQYGIIAEYGVRGIQDNAALFCNYVSTGRLTFYKNEKAMKLEDVPAIVFSEIMRDLDMFVGVCSIGNDAEWQDDAYWQSRSFGDLSQIAKTRKTVLERLLPRLTKLKGKAHIDGKFLIVKGSLRTYKIHMGSSNILMEPNDQYLCIVPTVNEKSTQKLFIPFEGDRGLSIILSKAFMLAEDTKIKDTTITSQISR